MVSAQRPAPSMPCIRAASSRARRRRVVGEQPLNQGGDPAPADVTHREGQRVAEVHAFFDVEFLLHLHADACERDTRGAGCLHRPLAPVDERRVDESTQLVGGEEIEDQNRSGQSTAILWGEVAARRGDDVHIEIPEGSEQRKCHLAAGGGT